jgi:hypothetical protein
VVALRTRINHPAGILTCSQAGAKYGYALLWTLIPATTALIVVQQMAATSLRSDGVRRRPETAFAFAGTRTSGPAYKASVDIC